MAEQKWGYEGEGHGVDHELNRKVLLGSLVVIIVLTLGAMTIGRGVFAFLKGDLEAADPPPLPRVEAQERRVPPDPRLQDHPESDLVRMRAEDERVLGSYAWENQGKGTVRVPIERAMEMVLENGLPVWPEIEASQNQPSAAGGGRQ